MSYIHMIVTEATEAHFFAQELSPTHRFQIRRHFTLLLKKSRTNKLEICKLNMIAVNNEPLWLPYMS